MESKKPLIIDAFLCLCAGLVIYSLVFIGLAGWSGLLLPFVPENFQVDLIREAYLNVFGSIPYYFLLRINSLFLLLAFINIALLARKQWGRKAFFICFFLQALNIGAIVEIINHPDTSFYYFIFSCTLLAAGHFQDKRKLAIAILVPGFIILAASEVQNYHIASCLVQQFTFESQIIRQESLLLLFFLPAFVAFIPGLLYLMHKKKDKFAINLYLASYILTIGLDNYLLFISGSALLFAAVFSQEKVALHTLTKLATILLLIVFYSLGFFKNEAYILANPSLHSKDFNAVIRILRQKDSHTKAEILKLSLAYSMIEESDHHLSALETMESQKTKYEDDADYMYTLSEIYERLNKDKEALIIRSEIISKNPQKQFHDIIWEIGMCITNKKKYFNCFMPVGSLIDYQKNRTCMIKDSIN
ncbi:MAG: hypothetical protein HRT89_17085 [Lentisphaeria bacterium]|nr:hypothetical protein [Lentisphaeria bacterium]